MVGSCLEIVVSGIIYARLQLLSQQRWHDQSADSHQSLLNKGCQSTFPEASSDNMLQQITANETCCMKLDETCRWTLPNLPPQVQDGQQNLFLHPLSPVAYDLVFHAGISFASAFELVKIVGDHLC